MFPPNLKNELSRGKTEQVGPTLDEMQVYEKIVHAKKPKSSVKGDLKVPLVENFAVELAEPWDIGSLGHIDDFWG